MGSQSSSSISPTIVLASFRGANFIAEQIESLQAQSHAQWRLLVRDDGSDDGTERIVRRMAERDPRIVLLEDTLGRLGAVGNFARLLEHARQEGAEWIALCDQDDRWLPEKLERQLEQVLALGSEARDPVLLYADMAVVGPELEPIHASLHALMGLRHEERTPLATLLIQNFVTGCSCLMNRALLEIALPISPDCVMVDWWLALCAAATGKLAFEPKPLLLYRQHGGNAIGARSLEGALRGVIGRSLSGRRHPSSEFTDTLRQAAALEQRLLERKHAGEGRERLDESVAFVSEYLALYGAGSGRLRRVLELHRRRIRRQTPLLDATLKLKLLTTAIEAPPSRTVRESIGESAR